MLNAYALFPLLEKASSRDILSKLHTVKRFEKLSRMNQIQCQKEEFYKVLLFCKNEIPYYRGIFKEQSFNVENVRKDINFIKDLPILTKDLVRENLDRLKLPSAHHIRKTGGSTGQSVHFYYDDNGLDWTSAINLQAYDMVKNFRHKRDCHISSELGIEAPSKKAKFLDWLKLFSQNRKRLMIESFSREDLECVFRDLKKIKPYLLQGHPSSAYAIANHIKESGHPQKSYCKIFEPSGEMLTEKIVNTIEEWLGAKVVNRYGNAEFGVMAHSIFSDSYNRLKVFERAFFIEDCEDSNIIVSNCTNYGMPLLRYDTGDVATVTQEEQGCFISDIRGRIHDTVLINDKAYATHYIMDYLDHKIRNVREFQIILKENSNPLINIVPENIEDTKRIKNEFLKRWPKGIDIEFIKFNQLQKAGWRQKFRHIIDKR